MDLLLGTETGYTRGAFPHGWRCTPEGGTYRHDVPAVHRRPRISTDQQMPFQGGIRFHPRTRRSPRSQRTVHQSSACAPHRRRSPESTGRNCGGSCPDPPKRRYTMGKSRQVNVTAPLPPRRRWTENTMAARHRRSTREKDPQVRTHLALPARAEMHLHAPRGSTPTQASPARSEIDHKPCRRTGPDRALSRDSGDRPSSSKGVATGLTPPRRCGDRPFRFLMNARQDRVPPHRRRYTSHRNHGGPLPQTLPPRR